MNNTSTPTNSNDSVTWESALPWASSVSSLPLSAGVYWFRNEKNEVLYVGKAKNLKSRVSSYTRLQALTGKTRQLVLEAKSLLFQELDTELDALLVEAELIRAHQPFYNLRLKDDKSPLYIYLTTDDFPSVKATRLPVLKKLNIPKNNIFGPFGSATKAKLIIKEARRAFPFCSATSIQRLKKQPCFYFHLKLCSGACVGLVSKEDYSLLISELRRFLRGKRKNVIDDLKIQMKLMSETKEFEKAAILRDRIQSLSYTTTASFAPELSLPQIESDIYMNRLIELRRILRSHITLPAEYPLSRIECYDISNVQGKEATGSMVVAHEGVPNSSFYRHFKIITDNSPNDYAMMGEMLRRRVKHPEWGIPNCIIIDGGKGQLKIALKEIPWQIPIISIAKNPDRLCIPMSDGKVEFLKLNPSNPATQLIQQLRNESHRFARRYHHKLRDKTLI